MKNDYEKAKELLQEYAQKKAEKAEKQDEMKAIELDLKSFATKNKKLFKDGTLEFPEVGKLRFASVSKIEKIKEKFKQTEFYSKFRHLCNVTIPVSGVKQAMQDEELKETLEEAGIRIKNVTEFKVEC